MDNDTYQGWLKYYNEARAIKSPVQYTQDDKKKKRLPMAEGVFESFIIQITAALAKSSAYLDARGISMPKPLWKYDPDDPTTWVSSPHFAYGHLL